MGILNASTVLNNGSVTSSCIFLGRASYRVMNLRFCYSRGLYGSTKEGPCMYILDLCGCRVLHQLQQWVCM